MQATADDTAAALGRELGTDLVETITFFMVQAGRAATAADYARAVRTIHTAGRAVERQLQNYDVVLSPTMAAPPVAIGELALSNAPSAEYISRLQAK